MFSLFGQVFHGDLCSYQLHFDGKGLKGGDYGCEGSN